MTTTEAALVSGAVVALTQLAKWTKLIPDRYGPLSVLVWSLLGVAIWAFGAESFRRAAAFELFSGWITVSLAAAGIYGFTRAGAEGLTRVTPPPSGAGAEPVTAGAPTMPAPLSDDDIDRITRRGLELMRGEGGRPNRVRDTWTPPEAPGPLDEPAFLRRGGR